MKFDDITAIVPAEKALTPKQAMFVREYLIDLNATQAAIRAGYSAKTAQEQSSRLLSNVMVAKAVQAGMNQRAEKVEFTADEVLRNIKRIARVAEDTGDLKNALRGNELLGKHLKLFTDKIEHNGNISISVVTGVDRG